MTTKGDRDVRRYLVVMLVLAMAAGACTRGEAEPTTTTVPTTTTTPAVTTTTVQTEALPAGFRPRPLPAFAFFEEIPLLEGGSYPGPGLPDSLAGVLKPVWLTIEPAAAATLLQNGFVVVPADYRQFQHAYASFQYQGEVFFVTTDVGYHFLHLAFSKVLRDLEEQTLLPILEDLIVGLVTGARAQQAELAGTELEEAASRVTQLFEAGALLLGTDVGQVGPLARQEASLAEEGAQLVASPTTSFGECLPIAGISNCVDYSLFKPRGHYTRSEDLERYFRAMSLLGQSSFWVKDPQSLRLGVLAARVLVSDPDLVEAWRLIYEPTAFMVGIADDYTPFELADVAAQVVATGLDDPAAFRDRAAVDEVGRRLLASREVGIDPEAAAVRIMGVRFVIDSFIYDQLRFPNVGDLQQQPLDRRYASPLDLAAVFGSELAYRLQDEAGETDYLNYDEQLEKLQRMVADRSGADWAATVYDAWLYALEPMWSSHGEAFPEFMRTEAWAAKDLQTGLGSYTELKHDTILYAKQSFAAEGDFEPMTEPPRHWVEPDPVAFERMAAVVGLLQDGLRNRGLVTAGDDRDLLMSGVGDLLERLARIAGEELAGLPISEADNAWLEAVGSTLEGLWVETADWDESIGMPSADDLDAALVADIMRTSFKVLELGTGRIDTIYVLVPNDSGHFQVAVGGVFSYYEFWRDATEGRLNDAEWRQMLDAGAAPERPAWQQVFFPGSAGEPAVLEAGLFCRDLADRGHGFPAAVGYWLREGIPDRMDADGNGIPCETVYGTQEVQQFLFGGSWEPGLRCRDVADRGGTFEAAVAYWLVEGVPDRMDADGNGIPCETVYPAEEVTAFVTP